MRSTFGSFGSRLTGLSRRCRGVRNGTVDGINELGRVVDKENRGVAMIRFGGGGRNGEVNGVDSKGSRIIGGVAWVDFGIPGDAANDNVSLRNVDMLGGTRACSDRCAGTCGADWR